MFSRLPRACGATYPVLRRAAHQQAVVTWETLSKASVLKDTPLTHTPSIHKAVSKAQAQYQKGHPTLEDSYYLAQTTVSGIPFKGNYELIESTATLPNGIRGGKRLALDSRDVPLFIEAVKTARHEDPFYYLTPLQRLEYTKSFLTQLEDPDLIATALIAIATENKAIPNASVEINEFKDCFPVQRQMSHHSFSNPETTIHSPKTTDQLSVIFPPVNFPTLAWRQLLGSLEGNMLPITIPHPKGTLTHQAFFSMINNAVNQGSFPISAQTALVSDNNGIQTLLSQTDAPRYFTGSNHVDKLLRKIPTPTGALREGSAETSGTNIFIVHDDIFEHLSKWLGTNEISSDQETELLEATKTIIASAVYTSSSYSYGSQCTTADIAEVPSDLSTLIQTAFSSEVDVNRDRFSSEMGQGDRLVPLKPAQLGDTLIQPNNKTAGLWHYKDSLESTATAIQSGKVGEFFTTDLLLTSSSTGASLEDTITKLGQKALSMAILIPTIDDLSKVIDSSECAVKNISILPNLDEIASSYSPSSDWVAFKEAFLQELSDTIRTTVAAQPPKAPFGFNAFQDTGSGWNGPIGSKDDGREFFQAQYTPSQAKDLSSWHRPRVLENAIQHLSLTVNTETLQAPIHDLEEIAHAEKAHFIINTTPRKEHTVELAAVGYRYNQNPSMIRYSADTAIEQIAEDLAYYDALNGLQHCKISIDPELQRSYGAFFSSISSYSHEFMIQDEPSFLKTLSNMHEATPVLNPNPSEAFNDFQRTRPGVVLGHVLKALNRASQLTCVIDTIKVDVPKDPEDPRHQAIKTALETNIRQSSSWTIDS